MADEKNYPEATWLTVPEGCVRGYTVQMENGEPLQLAEVTLPKGFTDTAGNDLSYFRFTVRDYQVDPGKSRKSEKSHTIRIPQVSNKTGEEWNIKMYKETGHYEDPENKQGWVTDERLEYECTSKQLDAAVKARTQAYKESKTVAAKGQDAAARAAERNEGAVKKAPSQNIKL